MGTRTIAIANQKGGVGKTTTTLCLADSLRRLGRRTLGVDLDQQANATRTYGVRTDGVATTYDILTGRVRDASGAVVSTPSGDIVPGDIAMAGVEVEMAGMTCRETVLADAMAGVVAGGAYDYVIIDCSPSLGVVTTNALVLAQEVVVPVLVDGYSLDGLGKLMRLVGAVRANRRLNPGLRVSGLLVCQREPRQRLTDAYDEQLPALAEHYGTRVLGTSIRRCVRVREAQVRDELLGDYAPGCTTAADYDSLALEIDGMADGGRM